MRTLNNQAAIVGIGATEFSKNSGRSDLQLAGEGVRNALEDCGLKPSDVDGMTSFTLDISDDIEVARAVGIGDLKMFSRIPHGGGAAWRCCTRRPWRSLPVPRRRRAATARSTAVRASATAPASAKA